MGDFDWVGDDAVAADLDRLARDLASFCNVDERAVVADISGALRGEVSMVRAYGVHLSAPDHLGFAERVRFVHAGLMAQTTTAQGDFDRALRGAS